MPVTIHDIAAHLNLSVSTVSRALNGYDDVAAQTRARVAATARELGYFPSSVARSLRLQKTERIGFLYGFATADVGEYASRLINGAVRAAEEASYNILLYPLSGDRLAKLKRIVQMREVDGLLLMGGAYMAESIALLDEERIPFVVLNRLIDQPSVSYIAADYAGATVAAVQHLTELGHRRIGFMGQTALEHFHRARLASFRQALRFNGVEVDETLIVSAGTQAGDGYRLMTQMLAQTEPPSALVAIHDPLAIECLRATVDAGLRVPDDIAIVGADNLRASQATSPPLTTIHPPLAEIGQQAVHSLLLQIAKAAQHPIQRLLPARFVIRGSTSG